MIVDCHAHLLPPWRMAKLIQWTQRLNPRLPVPEDIALEALLAEYRQAGVEAVWNFAHAIFADETETLNTWNHRLGEEHPEVVPIGTCHPETPEPLTVVDRCFEEYRFLGMKFHPYIQRFVPWEPRFLPIFERIAYHRGLVIFHTGFEELYGGALPLEGFRPIVELRELTVVLAHANYPRVEEAFEFVARYPNVYVDTVHLFAPEAESWASSPPQQEIWARLREGLAAFPDRVMFGTDHPSGTGWLADMYRDVRAFGLAPDLEAKLLGDNAVALMRRLARGPSTVPSSLEKEPGAHGGDGRDRPARR